MWCANVVIEATILSLPPVNKSDIVPHVDVDILFLLVTIS